MRLLTSLLLLLGLSLNGLSQPNLTFTNNNSYNQSGNTLSVSVEVDNDAASDITTAFDVNFYLSQTQSLASTYQIGSQQIQSLAAFDEKIVSISPDVCGLNKQIPDGNYYILVEADPQDNINEQNEQDNIIIFNNGPHFTANCPKPNLTIDTTNTQQSISTQNNRKLTVRYTIANKGQKDANQSFEAGVYLSPDTTISRSDRRIKSVTYNRLSQGSSRSEVISGVDICGLTPKVSNGNYHVGGIVDDQSDIPESDDFDNTLTYQNGPQLTLKCPKADLTTTYKQLSVADDSVHFSLTVENQGGKAASSAGLNLYGFTDDSLDQNDLLLRKLDLGNIQSKQTVQVDTGFSLCGTPNLQKGVDYKFGAIVDPADQVSESTDTNNRFTFSTTTSAACNVNLTFRKNSSKTFLKKQRLGNTLKASVDLLNKGAGTPGKRISVGFVVSTDQTLDLSEDRVFKLEKIDPIGGGQSRQFTVRHNFCDLPVQVQQDKPLYIFMMVDFREAIKESQEDDNVLSYPNGPHITVGCKPEFKVTERKVYMKDPEEDESVRFEITVDNIGYEDAGPFSIGLYAARDNRDPVGKDDIFIGELDVGGINKEGYYSYFTEDKSFYLCKTLKYSDPYHYAYVIDHKDEVDEINEDNNTYNFSDPVGSNCEPDFSLRTSTIDGSKPFEFRNNGDTLDVTVTLGNGSYVPNTSPVDIDFYLSKDQRPDFGPLGSDIKVGRAQMLKQITLYGRDDYSETGDVTFQKDLDNLDKAIANGNYHVGVFIDPENEFKEEKEGNNKGILPGGPHITVNTDNSTTGLSQHSAKAFRVYPNPVESRLTISLPAVAQDAQVEVQTLNGKVLKERQVSGSQAFLRVGELSNGTYILLMKDQHGQILSRKRVVKVE